MELQLILLIKAFCLGFLITYFEPLQALLQYIRPKSKNKWINYINESTACHKCLATWICFGLSGSIFLAGAAAVMVYVFDLLMLKLRR